MAIRLTILACLILAVWLGSAAANERRLALVVGVANYKHAPALANTHNDARSMTDALRRVGFEVEQLLDPDRAALETGVRNLRQRARGAETALFFYAGHALELGGRNWLLPVGTDMQSDRDLRFEGLDLDSILEQLEGSAGVALVFLDACRDNPFRQKIAGGTREAPSRGLARITSGFGTLIAFSTAPGTVALDGAGTNSPFTAALLKRIETPGLELRRMLSQVRVDVREATGGRQIPWENSALEGDFFFRTAAPTPAAAAPVQPSVTAPDREIVFWNSISASRDPADFRAYLAQFPQGVFAELARNRLAQMQAALAPPAAPLPPAAAPPAPGSEALVLRLAAVAPEQAAQARQDIVRSYAGMGGSKALAILPGTTKTFRAGSHASAESAATRVLEACQFHHNGPCALLAVDDTVLPAPADGRLVRRDMARVRYDRHFDPERIPAVRPNVAGRPDVLSYRAASGPKAAAFHPWGRLFVATAAPGQRAAEEQALAACNADPSRKGADGPCFLYAVGNKVILPQRLTAPRAPAMTIGEAISVLAVDPNLASNYAAENDNKALAIEPESGRSYRSGGAPTAEVAERTALEGCQISYALPCVLVASNDQLRAPDPLGAKRHDMPRVRHTGPYQPDKVPMHWSSAAQDTLKAYGSYKGHKALAIRPVRTTFFAAHEEKSAAEAERKALAGCNARGETPFPCILYAVNNNVILPQRRTEPAR